MQSRTANKVLAQYALVPAHVRRQVSAAHLDENALDARSISNVHMFNKRFLLQTSSGPVHRQCVQSYMFVAQEHLPRTVRLGK